MANIVKPIYHKLEEAYSVNEYYKVIFPFLEIKGANYKAKFSSFEEVTFEGFVHFENTDLSIGLFFEGCTFNEPLVFTNIKASGFDATLNPDSQNIVFKNCIFQNKVLFTGKTSLIERAVYFEDCTFNGGLEITDLNISVEGFTIKNCTINKSLDLFNVTVNQDFHLAGNTVNCFFLIENLSSSFLALTEDNIFNEDFHVRNSKFKIGIIFNNGKFKKEITFNSTTSKTALTIIGSVFENSFFVQYHSGTFKPVHGINSFYFSNSKFNNGIYISGVEDLAADKPFDENIEIHISAELKGNIEFRNLNVGILNMRGNNTSANIYLEDLFINQIKIKGLINNAGLIFSRIKASHEVWYRNKERTIPRENALYIDDSNFGKAQFYQVDFSSFKTIVFHNNILTEISTSLVKWFTPEQLESKIETHSILSYEQAKKTRDKLKIQNAIISLISTYRSRQEIFRQLKFASQKQGDMPLSLDFQRHEMNYYRKIVAIRKPRKWSEHIILLTNQTNDFGQNWLKAFGLLVLFSFLSYIPIGFFTSDKLDYSKWANCLLDIWLNLKVIIWDNLKEWMIILNPTHRVKDLNENLDKYSSWIYFWDILSRIIVSYFIFQTISAFRKFTK